ncbi:MAG: prepilin peptidase [Bacilli bacterium]|jgi:leader peptidase (prepilin peptidase)/N-methyltransferase
MNNLYYIISFFIFGLMFGSFFNVVGLRLSTNQSIIYPPSSCPKCGRRLSAWELIPVISYIILLGKCHGCKQPISWRYPLFELLTGFLFAASYIVFGMTLDLIIALTFISGLIIIIISDINSMTIPDEILIVTSLLIIIELLIGKGYQKAFIAIGNGLLSFILMFGIKFFGDALFKRESLGGGDIKLMFLIGLVLHFWLSIFVIVLGAFMALPIAILILIIKRTNIISFGPFLSLASIIIYLLKINLVTIINYFIKY